MKSMKIMESMESIKCISNWKIEEEEKKYALLTLEGHQTVLKAARALIPFKGLTLQVLWINL
jgi:hypothetical protein